VGTQNGTCFTHLFVAHKVEVAHRFLENLCTSGVKYKIQNTDFLFQNVITVSSPDYTVSTWAMMNK